ncbi:MAG: hypothetical protein ABSE08_09970 [Syntrophobacteraceae bacterium]
MLALKIRLYHYAKRIIPRRVQIGLRRKLVEIQLSKHSGVWPICESAGSAPEGWTGWPGLKKFALVLTHDVDSKKGLDNCLKLAEIEERLGFRSSFNFVAGEYKVSPQLREELQRRGFEVGIHGLYHDSTLYHTRDQFLKQVPLINRVLKEWNAVGFRSPCMYHHLDWLQDLDIEYDSSTFDTDPFEPQPDGLHTIFPLNVCDGSKNRSYVELPYTLPQDFTLFILMRNRNIDIWKKKLDWVVRHGGMALFLTHPDWMHFGESRCPYSEYPADFYRELLEHVHSAYLDQYWHPLPREMASFWSHGQLNADLG